MKKQSSVYIDKAIIEQVKATVYKNAYLNKTSPSISQFVESILKEYFERE